MQTDWLFGFPLDVAWDVQVATVETDLAANPLAAAIPEEEAELFVAAGYLARFLNTRLFDKVCKAVGVPFKNNGERSRRQAVIRVLRRWKERQYRDLLCSLILETSFGRFQAPVGFPAVWTEELFRAAYADGIHIVWLVRAKRFLENGAGIRQWVKSLGPFAAEEYELWLNIGRLAIQRIVYPAEQAESTAAAAAAVPHEALSRELKAKDQLSGALRNDVRQLQKDRKQLREESRRAELQRRALLTQAEGEVAAARRAQIERRLAREQELAAQARRHEADLVELKKRLAAARTEFVREMGSLTGSFLQGQTVSIHGGDPDLNQLLVETLGGAVAVGTGDANVSGDSGVSALEDALHAVALQQVEIHCDGLHRRKGDRPGIAAAAFQAYVGGQPVHRGGRVVCCGPAANSQMAEYAGVAMALTWLLAAGPAGGAQITLLSDCRPVVDQINGRRDAEPIRGCKMLAHRVERLLLQLRKRGCQVTVGWVRREFVDAEDRLCDLAYRQASWYHRPGGVRPRMPLKAFLSTVGQ